MEIVRRAQSMREVCKKARANGRTIGLVPTMGALHRGHLSLVRRVKELADVVIVSIFVNPTQFGPEEDFDRYPRDLARDVDLCIAEEVDFVFAPKVDELYPSDAETIVECQALSARIEGVSRPGHFRGVTTVVAKLFNIVEPTLAAFGQKDAQQAVIIKRMVRDLMFDVEVLVLPIVRDEDGVALSSRNSRLTPEQRETARAIPAALNAAREAIEQGVKHVDRVLEAASEPLEAAPGLEIDYLELVGADDLERVEQIQGPTLLLVAARVGDVRLLDNVRLEP